MEIDLQKDKYTIYYIILSILLLNIKKSMNIIKRINRA